MTKDEFNWTEDKVMDFIDKQDEFKKHCREVVVTIQEIRTSNNFNYKFKEYDSISIEEGTVFVEYEEDLCGCCDNRMSITFPIKYLWATIEDFEQYEKDLEKAAMATEAYRKTMLEAAKLKKEILEKQEYDRLREKFGD